jgi:hypothetical protein
VANGSAANGSGADALHNGNGARPNGASADPAQTNGGTEEKRILRVVVPRNADDNACVRMLEQLHVLVDRFPGRDELQLIVHARDGARIELSGADIPVKSSELEGQVRTLVGESNVELLTRA